MVVTNLIEIFDYPLQPIHLLLQFLLVRFSLQQVHHLVQIGLVGFILQVGLYFGQNHLELAGVNISTTGWLSHARDETLK